eukprot:g2529.t1
MFRQAAFLLPPDIYTYTSSSSTSVQRLDGPEFESTVIALEPIIASSAKVPPEEKKQARPAVGTAKADVGDSADTDMDTSTWVESEDSDLKELFGHNGVKLTAGIIVADVVGAGILAMPVVQGSGSSD